MRLSSTLLLAGLLPTTLLAFPTSRLDDLISRDTQKLSPPLMKRTPGKSQTKGKSQAKGKKGKANGNGNGNAAGNATVIVIETPAPVAAPVVAAPVVATPAPVAAPVVEAPAAGEEEEALPGK